MNRTTRSSGRLTGGLNPANPQSTNAETGSTLEKRYDEFKTVDRKIDTISASLGVARPFTNPLSIADW